MAAGMVKWPLRSGLSDLFRMPTTSLIVTRECAGNGRARFDPRIPGERWRIGAASTAEWTGVPLEEVLNRAG